MDRHDCKSRLSISISQDEEKKDRQVVTVWLEHAMHHVSYYDVQMPKAAHNLVRENLWAVPSALSAKIQEDFPQVSVAQFYHTWVTFSEKMWK